MTGAPHDLARPVTLQGWYDLTAWPWRYEPAEVHRGEPTARWSPGVEVRFGVPRAIR